MIDPQRANAEPNSGHRLIDPLSIAARQDKGGQPPYEPPFLSAVLSELREVHKLREDFHREEKSLTLRIKAIDRRLNQAITASPPSNRMPDHTDDGAKLWLSPKGSTPHTNGEDRAKGTLPSFHRLPDENGGLAQHDTHNDVAPTAVFIAPELFEARQIIHKARLKYERRMKKLAKELPVYHWMKAINGFGELGLPQIIAETGDLSNYANPGKVWRRMGLAPFRNKALATWRRQGGLTKDDWIEAGYSPRRRSIMYCIGDSLIKKQNVYRDIYLERKEFEREKLPDAAPIHTHRRAQRYMEKRLLKNLWQEWQRAA